MSYEQRMKHQNLKPSHIRTILTSKFFASEDKFIELARSYKRSDIKEGVEKFLNPYKTKMRKRKDQEENSKNETKKEVDGLINEDITQDQNTVQETMD